MKSQAMALVALSIHLLWSVPAGAGTRTVSSKAWTLERCVREALIRRPDLQGIRAGVEAASASTTMAQQGYYPSLSMVLGYQGVKYSFNPKGGKPPGEAKSDILLGAYLNWPLLDLLATSAEVDHARARERGRRFHAAAGGRRVALEVALAYYRALKRKRLIEVARSSMERARIHRRLARARFTVAKASRADVLRAGVELASSRLVLIRARQAARSAMAELKSAMGLPQPRGLPLADVILKIPDGLLRTVKGAIRPEVEVRKSDVQAAREKLKHVKRRLWPSLSLLGGLEVREDQFFPGKTNWYVGFSLEVPIFKYPRLLGEIRKNRAELKTRKAEKSDLERRIDLEVRRARLDMEAVKEALGATRLLVKSARENLKIAEERYRHGMGSMVELADARTAYTGARGRLTSTTYDAYIAAARYRYAEGRKVIP